MSQNSPTLYQRIYALVHQVPPGYVTSYGQIGRLSGCSARTVGFALAALPPGSDVPWQRVINAQGRVSQRTDAEGNILQRELLESEGLHFDQRQQINLTVYGWDFGELRDSGD